MSEVTFTLPPTVLEQIAQRAAEITADRTDAWLSAQEAADYLRCPLSRIRALTSARRIPVHHDGSRCLYRRSELDTWVRSGGGKRP